MAFDAAGIAAVFGEDKGPVVFDHIQFAEIVMNAFKISAALVEPAACLVNGAGFVLFADKLCNAAGIELSPAFVEGNPNGDGGDII